MTGGGGHRVTEQWMGEDVETLEDLLKPGLRAVCVGINPAPVSVAVGHYYQGKLGKRFWARLQQIGLLAGARSGAEDDAAFEEGIGFTDIVKRPSPSEKDLAPEDFDHGRELLRAKLENGPPGMLIFVFKKAATGLFGPFSGHGFTGHQVAGVDAFVMPGPFERADKAAIALGELRARL